MLSISRPAKSLDEANLVSRDSAAVARRGRPGDFRQLRGPAIRAQLQERSEREHQHPTVDTAGSNPLLQLRVLRLGLDEDGDVGVGVFP
jgi:hypothetical protein